MTAELLYLDSSAIVKLVAREPETDALVERLRSRPDLVSSGLARVEVARAVRRARLPGVDVPRAEAVLERIALLRIDEAILESAGLLDPPDLRSLDAVHLASALSLGEALAGLVTYDDHLASAAQTTGLQVVAPS